MKLNILNLTFSCILLILSISLINSAKESNLNNVSLLGDFSHFAESLFSDKLSNKNDEYFIENKENSNISSNVLRSSGNSEYKDLTRIISSNDFNENEFSGSYINNELKAHNVSNVSEIKKDMPKNLKVKQNIKNDISNLSNTSHPPASSSIHIQTNNHEVNQLKKNYVDEKIKKDIKKNNVNINTNKKVEESKNKKSKSTEEILNEIYDDLV